MAPLPWTAVQPLLAALTAAGVPLRTGDLEQLRRAAVIGPEFARVLARWIRDAHAGAATGAAPAPLPSAPVLRSIAPRAERPALGAAPPVVRDLQAS
ncbi:hypothetical protein ACIA8O_06425 [Kitasatospora sp. NPDC051853]|uniref:hypothetical protein n=1 Tax=Kitasatospora sp. NPDC051853 TaxID=3364058 RepID=UPI00379B40A1